VGPAWVVDSVPVTDIAGSTPSGDAAFLSVAAAVRLSDGTIVIGDRFASSVRYFASTGHEIRSVGRAGSGPGEFRSIAWIGRCGGDTVFVWDYTSRMTVLGPAGTMVRQFPVPADSAGARPPVFFTCGPGGVWAGLTPVFDRLPSDMATSTVRIQGVLALFDRDGHVGRLVDSVTFGQTRVFGHLTRLALSDDRLYVGTEDSAYVARYALDGARLSGLPVGIGGREVSDRAYEDAIDAQVAVVPNAQQRETARKQMLRIPKPKTLAPYFALFAVGHDTLWAQISAPGDSVTVLDAVGPDGKPAGEARIPRDLRVLDMGRDYVLGEYDAPDGEQHVMLYRMHPPS